MKRTARPVLLALVAIAALTLLAGCGKKGWPMPSAPEDAFSFTRVTGTTTGTCLKVESRLAGAWRNLTAVHLELSWDDCTECPFSPMAKREYVPGTDACTIDAQGRLTINACGLDSEKVYRWRLTARNIHRTLPDAQSEVMKTP